MCEYASGIDSTIPRHEAYQYVLDTLPMFVALVLFNVVHPGRIMPGRDSDLPSRKERKKQYILVRADRSAGATELVHLEAGGK